MRGQNLNNMTETTRIQTTLEAMNTFDHQINTRDSYKFHFKLYQIKFYMLFNN